MDNDTAFSRRSGSPMQGKRTRCLKTMAQDEVAEDLTRFARENGFSSDGDCLFELVLVAMYGPEYMLNLHRQRLASLARVSTRSDTPEPASRGLTTEGVK